MRASSVAPLLACCLGVGQVLGRDQLVLSAEKQHRPLVIWHGLGDTALSDGISSFIDDIKSLYPGIYVYSVQIPEGGTADDERKAGFYGEANEQAQSGCEQIANITELSDGVSTIQCPSCTP